MSAFQASYHATLEDGEEVTVRPSSDEKGPLVSIGLATSGAAEFTPDEASEFIGVIEKVLKEINS